MPRLNHVPSDRTRGQVTAFVVAGISRDLIARHLGLDQKTLRKYYSAELDGAKALVDAQIAGGLIRKAIDGDLTASIFYLKTRCGWSEKSQVEHTASKTLADLVRESEAAAKNSTEDEEES